MSKRKIHFSDSLEADIASILEALSVNFIHESEGATLDFYLPDFDVHIEIKQFYSDRIIRQMSENANVILIQGRKSLELLKNIVQNKTRS